MREIVLDTETTGFDPFNGDRVVEIGALELLDHIATGRTYHQYVNPERDMPDDAFKVHGLSEEFLSGFPVFAEIAADFIDFVGDSTLVIHNAAFDMKFLNFELDQIGGSPLTQNNVVDTLPLAQRKYPGAPANLDALCRRFGVDGSRRTRHGALLDSELLAEVYLHLIGGRQRALGLDGSGDAAERSEIKRVYREPRHFPVSEAELEAHRAFIAKIDNPIWLD